MASPKWPAFAGELVRDEAGLAPYETDFGRDIVATPRAVLRAACVEDIARAIRFAHGEGLPVVARGQGHTTRGQSLSSGGLVIDTARLDRVLELGDDFVRVQAGARWHEVLRATLATGLTPPVLTDYLELSVGGTLSVGGVGGQSFRHGLQIDNVLELAVVTGRGELVRCSPARDAALFDACRGGLGQFGVIVEAKLRLVRAPERVRVFHLTYPDLDGFLQAQHALAEDARFDYVIGNFLRGPGAGLEAWRFSLECVHYGAARDGALLDRLAFIGKPEKRELGYYEYASRLGAAVAELERSGAWAGVHRWIDLFLPASQADLVIATALSELEQAEVEGGYVMTYPLSRLRCHSPFPGLPDEERLFLFDVLPSFPRGSPLIGRFAGKCERWLADARRVGGTVYPIGFPIATTRMQSADWRRQLGGAFDALAQVKRDVDPDGVLNPRLEMFV